MIIYGKNEGQYDVSFNKEELTKLIDDIVKNVNNIKKEVGCEYSLDVGRIKDDRTLSSPLLPNGSPRYINVDKVEYYSSNSQVGYHNDRCKIYGVEVEVPRLAYILKNIIDGDSFSIDELLEYKDHSDIVPLLDRVMKLENEITTMDFSDPAIVDAIIEYQKLLNKKDENVNDKFNTDLLKEYYDRALELVKIKSVTKPKKLEKKNTNLS